MSKAKILYIDIETSPNVGIFWRPGKQFVSHEQILVERKIICISYKWEGKSKIHTIHWGHSKQCDKTICKKIAKVINKADLIIGQNHKRFDMKWINGRNAFHNLAPLHVDALNMEDTLLNVRAAFNLNSNSLAYTSKFFGVTWKKDGGGWDRVKLILNKDKAALEEHIEYCEGDVKATEELMLKIRPHVTLKKHLGIINGKSKNDTMPCGHDIDNTIKYGYYYTSAGKYQKRQCKDCGYVHKDMSKRL